MTRAVQNTGKTVSASEFRRMWHDPELTVAQIGVRLGITRQAVTSRARTRGLGSRQALSNARRHSIKDPLFADMWIARVRFCDLMQHYGVCAAAVCNTAARLGLPKRGRNAHNTITITEFREAALGRALAASAEATRAAMDRTAGASHAAPSPYCRAKRASDPRAIP